MPDRNEIMIRKNCTLTYPPGGCNKYKKKENNFMPFVVVPSHVVLLVHPQNLTANCLTSIACVEK